ncbi:hypothetical protein ACQ86N_36260 [Puia sp. P3]|uniref:hypothetical protein n=1 Tax=Puia sp. P3 TaxID=3423952 RepID=UPI003D67CC30
MVIAAEEWSMARGTASRPGTKLKIRPPVVGSEWMGWFAMTVTDAAAFWRRMELLFVVSVSPVGEMRGRTIRTPGMAAGVLAVPVVQLKDR